MRPLAVALLLALAACGGSSDDADGLSDSQRDQLNAAAAAIDINAMDGNQAGQ